MIDRDRFPQVGQSLTLPASTNPVTSFPIVGIGASAGGLDACRSLLDVIPANTGIAFILVQHLDPTHENLMVELLAGQTAMTVLQAAEGMRIKQDYFYVIPPGRYLSVNRGVLCISEPLARHGARMPFDFLLRSLAADCGSRAGCIVLSGTGTDGSLGLSFVNAQGGIVIAQDPAEAGRDGMPRAAIATGLVDHVLPVAQIPAALAEFARRSHAADGGTTQSTDDNRDYMPVIIELLRLKTVYDFTHYKRGTTATD